MSIAEIIGILLAWSFCGFIFICLIMSCVSSFLENIRGLEYNNPFVIYKLLKVNIFGAIMIALGLNLLCPIASLCYWFYKLCTVGRRYDE